MPLQSGKNMLGLFTKNIPERQLQQVYNNIVYDGKRRGRSALGQEFSVTGIHTWILLYISQRWDFPVSLYPRVPQNQIIISSNWSKVPELCGTTRYCAKANLGLFFITPVSLWSRTPRIKNFASSRWLCGNVSYIVDDVNHFRTSRTEAEQNNSNFSFFSYTSFTLSSALYF